MGVGNRNRLIAIVLAALILTAQPGCLFRKKKASGPPSPPSPIRLALLPLNVPSENNELRWVASASPALMAKVAEAAQDLEPVPLWETMPVALESVGPTRSVTPEQAAYVASRLTAKWCAMGELFSSKKGTMLRIDFIPAKTTAYAFRYEKEIRPDSMSGNFHEAFVQFLRYLVVRPLPKQASKNTIPVAARELGEALDREYGWFVPAEPGKAGPLVTKLAQSDSSLARTLFNPNLYSIAGGSQKAAPARLTPSPGTRPPKPD